MKLLEGKVALITGAARGIGKAIALKYASEGANIAFTDLTIDENAEKTKDYEKIDLIKKISPVAWRHINLYGRYKFHKKENTIDIQKIIDILEEKFLT